MAAFGNTGIKGIDRKQIEVMRERYQHLLCEECKERVVEATARLGALDLAFPQRTSRKFAKLLCYECKNKFIKKMKSKR